MTKSYWHNKKVLVTGGAGFIGSYLVELLIDDGAQVSVIDNLSRGRIENLSRVLNAISLFQNDMRNLDACRAAAAGKDIVLNLASPAFGIEYSSTHHGEMLTDVTLIGFNALRAD